MSASTLLAVVLMPKMRKHGYLGGTGEVMEKSGLRGGQAYKRKGG